jgi:hypothetical protein
MPAAPVEDFASVPADPEFAAAEAIQVQPVYQPQVEAVPVQPVGNPAPKVIGPVNYQNTSSNPYSEPDRASHNPYAAASAKPAAQAYGAPAAAAPAGGTGTASLILGIISIVICWSLSVIGIILSSIGIASASKVKRLNGGEYPNGKAKVGSVLSKIGLPLSIICLLIHIIIIIVVVILAFKAGKNLAEYLKSL